MKDTHLGATTMRLMDDADERLDGHSFPATTEELVAEHGDLEIELPNGTETLGDALSRAGSETFESSESAKLAARSGISEKGIGRKFYSDRDPPTVGDVGPDDVSL